MPRRRSAVQDLDRRQATVPLIPRRYAVGPDILWNPSAAREPAWSVTGLLQQPHAVLVGLSFLLARKPQIAQPLGPRRHRDFGFAPLLVAQHQMTRARFHVHAAALGGRLGAEVVAGNFRHLHLGFASAVAGGRGRRCRPPPMGAKVA